ncbi:MAG: histidine kinase [Paenibacillaceae bacterium]|jgi:two-component system sensor histidine kinase YesM|nr:histidine kinase [Paenibacillaceae bacterium]
MGRISAVGKMTIYPKLLTGFLLVIIPILILSLVMNESGSKSVNREIIQSADSTTKLYMSLLETDFSRIIRFQRELINDKDLLELAVKAPLLNEIQKMDYVLSIQRKLQLLANTSQYVTDVRVHFPSLNRTVSSAQDSILDFLDDEYQALRIPPNPDGSPFVLRQENVLIPLNYPDVSLMRQDHEQLFQIVLEVSKEQLSLILSRFNTNNGGMIMLAGHEAEWIVSDSNTNEFGGQAGSLYSELRDETKVPFATIGDSRYYVVKSYSEQLGITLIKLIPYDSIFGPIRTFRLYFWVLFLASVILLPLFSYWIYRMIYRPIKQLVKAFHSVEKGNMEIMVSYKKEDEFGYMIGQFNKMVGNLKTLIHEVYEQRYRLQLSEFRQLQSQIDPHFLYNTLFTVYRLAQMEEYQKIVHFTRYLSEYFQFVTRNSARDIPLRDECKHMENYIAIQSIRFSTIQVEFETIPEWAEQIQLPRLILQPIVENAYKYAVEDKDGIGLIRIGFQLSGDQATVTIEDNGDSLTDGKLCDLQRTLEHFEHDGESTGLLNVHRRLLLTSSGHRGLSLERSGLGGLKATVSLHYDAEGEG